MGRTPGVTRTQGLGDISACVGSRGASVALNRCTQQSVKNDVGGYVRREHEKAEKENWLRLQLGPIRATGEDLAVARPRPRCRLGKGQSIFEGVLAGWRGNAPEGRAEGTDKTQFAGGLWPCGLRFISQRGCGMLGGQGWVRPSAHLTGSEDLCSGECPDE
jgi:hypothetical protein